MQVVHTSLNAKHFREERRLHKPVLGIEVLEVPFTHTFVECPLDVVFLPSGLCVELGAGIGLQQTDGIILEEILHALSVGMRAGPLMDGLVEQLPCQVTQDSSLRGLRGLHALHQVHVGRFRIGREASCNGRDIHQVVGFQDDQFGIEHIVLPSRAHQVELGVRVEEGLHIRPVALVVETRLAVVHLQQVAVGLLRVHVDEVFVPRVDDHAHAFAFQFPLLLLALLPGETRGKRFWNHGLIYARYEPAEVSQVLKIVLPEVIVRQFLPLAEPGARMVGGSHQSLRCLVLLQQIVGLGEGTAEVQSGGIDFLVDASLEHAAIDAIQPPVVGQQVQPVFQLAEEVGGFLRLVELIGDAGCRLGCFHTAMFSRTYFTLSMYSSSVERCSMIMGMRGFSAVARRA